MPTHLRASSYTGSVAHLNRKQPTASADNSRRRLGAVDLEGLGAKTFFCPSDAAELGVDSRGLRRLVDDGSVERVARGSLPPCRRRTDRALLPRRRLHAGSARYHLPAVRPERPWPWHPAPEGGLDRHPAQGPHTPPSRAARQGGPLLRSIAALRGRECAAFEGVPARITSPARTVVDCFRFRRLVGKDVALEALGDALRERKASADQIWRAAEVCRAKSLVGPVLEVLSR